MNNKKLLSVLLITVILLAACGSNATNSLDLVPNLDESDEQGNDESTDLLKPVVKAELPGMFFVMIDDHPNARPQRNLDKADIVYEMVCEGTFTRFMAGFYNTDPVIVGPVRSLRYYFAQVAEAYNPVIAHIGGNMDALEYVKKKGLRSMCDITTASGHFERDKSRKMPHNAYVKSSKIIEFAQNKNYSLTKLPELNVGELVGEQSSSKISIEYGTKRYPHLVEWSYDEKLAKYERYLDSKKYLTTEGNSVEADNIVVIEAPVKAVQVPVDGSQSMINILTSGKALFLRDGYIFKGTWEKNSAKEHFVYRLEDGSPFVYKEGNVWVQQLASISKNLTIIDKDNEG